MSQGAFFLPVRSWGTLRLPESLRYIGEEAAGEVDRVEVAPARVLIVEDDGALAQMYRVRLEKDGHVVTLAPDGESGLELLGSQAFDIVLLDIGLPRADGLEVLESVRADLALSKLPVVILSNYNEPRMIERGLKLGAIEYLVKAHVTPGQLAAGIPRWRKG